MKNIYKLFVQGGVPTGVPGGAPGGQANAWAYGGVEQQATPPRAGGIRLAAPTPHRLPQATAALVLRRGEGGGGAAKCWQERRGSVTRTPPRVRRGEAPRPTVKGGAFLS